MLCVETLSHRRSMGDVARGSPGISGRLFGREGTREVTFTTTIGGPDAPAEWEHDATNAAQYLAAVDFDEVMKKFKADPIPRQLESHRELMLESLRYLAEKKKSGLSEPAGPGARSDNPYADHDQDTHEPGLNPDPIACEKRKSSALRAENTGDVPDADDYGEGSYEEDSDEVETWHELDATDEHGNRRTSTSGAKKGYGSMSSTANRGYRDKKGLAGKHYREVISVYADTFLWGIHSATITEVWQFVNGTWGLMKAEKACNHGSCPEDKGMQFRFRCAPDVVTYGWYGLGGECANRWGPASKDHFCNDDTALQINNAFGRWSGDYCAGKHRKHAPRCEPQW